MNTEEEHALLLDAVGLFYDAERNCFVDEDGFVIWSIFEIISPNDLYLFKEKREYFLIPHRNSPDLMVELYYPEDDY